MEGRSHVVTDETCTSFYARPTAQLDTDCSLYNVLATQLSEFPGSLYFLRYSNQYIFYKRFFSVCLQGAIMLPFIAIFAR